MWELKWTTLERELNQGHILNAVTGLRRRSAMARQGLAFKIYLVEKDQGPRLYVGRYIFSATDTVTRSTWAN